MKLFSMPTILTLSLSFSFISRVAVNNKTLAELEILLGRD